MEARGRAISGRSEDVITPLLTSNNAAENLFGRLLATGVADTIEAFLSAERNRGTDRVDLLTAFTNLAANVSASILLPEGSEAVPKEAGRVCGSAVQIYSHQLLQSATSLLAHYEAERAGHYPDTAQVPA